MEHYNNLTPAEAERIAILMEECGEVIQACGKILRHGYESYNPYDENKITNREQLAAKLGDLVYSIKGLEDTEDIKSTIFRGNANSRATRLAPYLHHQEIT